MNGLQIPGEKRFQDFFLLGLGEGKKVEQSGVNNLGLGLECYRVFFRQFFNLFKNIMVKTK